MLLSALLFGVVLTFPLVAVDEEQRRKHIDRLRRAIKLAGLTEDQACREMNIAQSHWSMACAGTRGQRVAYDWIMRLPKAVRCWYYLLGAEDEGLPAEVTRSARLALALMSRKQARAHLMRSAEKDRRLA